MLDRDLFEIAIRDLVVAKYFYGRISQGDSDYSYNCTAFYSQQALEKCIKSISIGNDMGATHDIEYLINKAKGMNINLFLSDYLIKNAKIISIWEEDALYEIQYKVDHEKVKEVFPYVEEYLNTISKNVFKYGDVYEHLQNTKK